MKTKNKHAKSNTVFSSDVLSWSRHASDNYWQNYYAKARPLPAGGGYSRPHYNHGKNKGDLVSSDYGKFYQESRRVVAPAPLPPLTFLYPGYHYPAGYHSHDNYPTVTLYHSYPTGNHRNEKKALTEYRYYRDRDKKRSQQNLETVVTRKENKCAKNTSMASFFLLVESP